MMMRFAILIVAALSGVNAQGVTSKISPPAPIPSGCLANSGPFAIAVLPVEGKHVKRAPSSTSTLTLTTSRTTTIYPGSNKTVTLEELTTTTPKVTVTLSASVSTSHVVAVSQLGDGQPQDPIKTTKTGVDTIYSTMTFVNVATLIPDGQAQVPTTMKISTTTSTSLSSWTSVMPVHASAAKLAARQDDDADGYDNEIEVLPKTWIPLDCESRKDGCYLGPIKMNVTLPILHKRATANGNPELYTCASNKPLIARVVNNQLFDGKNWIGYIAANYQLQFDEGVAQNGALYTSGFSVCDGNKLALGNSTVFYKCLSGDFYNLYDRNWAPQCSPVELNLVKVDKNC